VPQISYSATSKTLSGRSRFFFRTCAPDSEKAVALANLVRKMPKFAKGCVEPGAGGGADCPEDWTHIGVVTTAKDYATSMADDVSGTWTAAGNKREFFHIVQTESGNLEAQVRTMVEHLHDSMVRVVVLCGHTHDVEAILRVVDRLNYEETATHIVWFA
jgi:hypothetical protein